MLKIKKTDELIYACTCGCMMRIFKQEDKLLLTSLINAIIPEEITFIDEKGFLNGQFSIREDGRKIVEKHLKDKEKNVLPSVL